MTERFLRFVEQRWNLFKPRGAFRWTEQAEGICEALEQFATSKDPMLIINAPPGCGKSSLASVLWPCWLWKEVRSMDVTLLSYSSDLANRDLNHTAGVLNGLGMLDRDKEFTRTDLHGTSGARMSAHQIGSSLMGRRSDMIIIDESLEKNRHLRNTKELLRHYEQSIKLKLNIDGKVVIIENEVEGSLSDQIMKEVPSSKYKHCKI